MTEAEKELMIRENTRMREALLGIITTATMGRAGHEERQRFLIIANAAERATGGDKVWS